MLRIFTCTNFKGHWPVGSAAVIIAENESDARSELWNTLKSRGLGNDDPSKWELIEIEPTSTQIRILCDGQY